MIATILPGSANFHAVGYNERKVAKGAARLIEMRNFGTLGTFGRPTADELTKYLQEYTSRNGRIRKAQFHVAVSCKGHEMSETEMLEFTHRYLAEMGYMEPGQPLLVYSHHDTDNIHLHVITSRIAPDGRKIAHSHERRRSQEAIDRILGTDRKQKTDKDIENAGLYTFSSFAQFKAVMSSMGYEAYKKDGTVFIKHGGKVQREIPLAEIEAMYKSGRRDRMRCRQLRGILLKYRDTCTDKEELKKEMKEKFGIDIVFFGRKDKPFGYMVVDHAKKTVIHGARVLSVEELLDFATPEERLDRVEDFIDRLLTLNPKTTQSEIYAKIRRQHAYIKKGVVYFGGTSRPLKPFMAEAIDRNNRIAWVERFRPATEAERDMLCRIFKVSRPDLVTLTPERAEAYNEAVGRLRGIFTDETVSLKAGMYAEGFILREQDGTAFAIDFKRHIIVNLAEEGFDLKRLKRKAFSGQRQTPSRTKTALRPFRLSGLKDAGGGSQSGKREWEVGHKDNPDDLDNNRQLRR